MGPVVMTFGFLAPQLHRLSAQTTKYFSVSTALPGPISPSQKPGSGSLSWYLPQQWLLAEK